MNDSLSLRLNRLLSFEVLVKWIIGEAILLMHHATDITMAKENSQLPNKVETLVCVSSNGSAATVSCIYGSFQWTFLNNFYVIIELERPLNDDSIFQRTNIKTKRTMYEFIYLFFFFANSFQNRHFSLQSD